MPKERIGGESRSHRTELQRDFARVQLRNCTQENVHTTRRQIWLFVPRDRGTVLLDFNFLVSLLPVPTDFDHFEARQSRDFVEN